jgi:hypothetical protein
MDLFSIQMLHYQSLFLVNMLKRQDIEQVAKHEIGQS